MQAEPPIPPNRPPNVIDYRNPKTESGRRWDDFHPIHPLLLAGTSAAFGLVMPNHAGGSQSAWIASFCLVVAAAWYIAARLQRDARVPHPWRWLLMLFAIACIILTALASVGGIERHLESWRAYGEIPALLLAAAGCASAYGIVRAGAWIDRHRRA